MRERREDIPLLVDYLMRRAASHVTRLPRVSPPALSRLVDYPWPGNVRELRNVIERLLVFNDGETIDEATVCSILSIPPEKASIPAAQRAFSAITPLEDFERDYIVWVLDKLDGNVSAAAAALGVSRSTVYRFLRAAQLAG
nr:helix-turn-helix domain-containing protein [Aromatoleum bremense]